MGRCALLRLSHLVMLCFFCLIFLIIFLLLISSLSPSQPVLNQLLLCHRSDEGLRSFGFFMGEVGFHPQIRWGLREGWRSRLRSRSRLSIGDPKECPNSSEPRRGSVLQPRVGPLWAYPGSAAKIGPNPTGVASLQPRQAPCESPGRNLVEVGNSQ